VTPIRRPDAAIEAIENPRSFLGIPPVQTDDG
jgi:hypothetical protein